MTMSYPSPILTFDNVQAPFPLLDIQTKAVQDFIARKRGSVTFATGIGKTAVALESIRVLIQGRHANNALFVVPRLALMQQFRTEASRWKVPEGLIGVFYGAEKNPRPMTFATYQSLLKHPQLMDNYDIVIFDEVHIVSGEKMGSLIDRSMSRPYVLGLSATIPKSMTELRKMLPVIADASIQTGVEVGRLAEPRLVQVPIQLGRSDNRMVVDATRRMDNCVSSLSAMGYIKRDSDIFGLLKAEFPGKVKALAYTYVGARARRNKVLSAAEVKFEALVAIIEEHLNERIMVFAESVSAIEKLCGYLEEQGIRAENISAKTTMPERAKIFQEFGDKFNVLVSVKTLEIGVDLKMMGLQGDVGIAVILASGREAIQQTQRMGRVLRAHTDKDRALIYAIYSPEFESHMVRQIQKLIT